MRAGEYLGAIDYPGRIAAAGYGKNGEPVLLYAITGRSSNSRNRVFRLEDGVLRTEPYDPSKVEDPSLIIYNAMRYAGETTVLTNGDQTDTIADFLNEGKSLEEALVTRTYEPDDPNFTPRISITHSASGYTLSIIRKNGDETERRIYSYGVENGVMHMIHTYMHDGSPLPSFEGLPARLKTLSSADEILNDAWNAIAEDRRISLYVRYGSEERIINAMEESNG